MSRSLKKGPFVEASILIKLEQIKERKDRKVVTKSRSSTVIPAIIGWTFLVYNGRTYTPILITDQIVGHKLGEFAFTRAYRGHNKTEKKRKRLIRVYGTKSTSCGIAPGNYLLF
jgi:small subunit ribosomal protein S19